MTDTDGPVRAELAHTVTDDDTALALGSGDVPVLATPRLVAWLEGATCAAAQAAGLTGGARTSVGTCVRVDHLLATAVGGRVEVCAEVAQVDGRQVRFIVTARDELTGAEGQGRLVATGEITRVVVDRDRFLARLGR